MKPTPKSIKQKFWISAALNWLVVIGFLFVGIDYVTATQPKPHHLQVLGSDFSSLTTGNAQLILTLLKGTGLSALVTAFSMAILLLFPFRQRENWSRWAILSIALIVLLPTLGKTIEVRLLFEAGAPWWPHVLMMTSVFVAFWLSRGFSSKS